MRFTEIANPEDQLALWKLVSDKMCGAFGQQLPQSITSVPVPQVAPAVPKPIRPHSRTPAKPLGQRKTTPVKVPKPKKVPMAPAPKPLPRPKPQQLTLTQVSKQQTQQHQQLAHHIHQAMMKKLPPQPYPQPTQTKVPVTTTEAPMNNSYSERDKDELVFHRRQNPFKPFDIK